MNRIFGALIGFLLTLSAAGQVPAKPFRLDPSKPMTQYVVSAWRDTSGLPVDSISALAQTRDGYVWLATEYGLIRFDGVRFTVFTKENTPALRSSDIYSLFTSRDGTLWIGTRGGGAVHFDGRVFSRLSVPYRFIIGFTQSGDGAIWVGAPGGLTRLHQGKIRNFEKKDGYPTGRLAALAADRDGVYVAFPTGVLRIDQRGVRAWSEKDGLSGEVQSLLWTSRGLLAGTMNGAVDRLAGERFENVIPAGSTQAVASIMEGADGSLWLATVGGGLVRHASGRLDRLTSTDGLTSDSLNQLLEDDEGNLWAASVGGGLIRFTQGSITPVLPPDSLADEWILVLAPAHDGSVWFTTRGGGLYRFQDGTLRRFTAADGLRNVTITALAEDREGTMWVGLGDGLQRVRKGGRFESLTSAEGLEGETVVALTAARDGSLWVSTDAGLHHIVNGQARRLTEKDGMTKGVIVSIREASDGSLWLAKSASVEHYVQGRVTSFTNEHGLRSRMITSIETDEKDGSIWVITMGSGVARIRNGHVRSYRASDGLPSDAIYALVQDRSGNLWMSTGLGVFTIRRADLDAFDEGKTKTLHPRLFRRADGLRSNDFSGGFDRPGFRADDGKLWFGTTRGLAVIDPETLRVDRTAPRVLIESVTAHGVPHNGIPIDLPPAHRQIEIAYTAPAYHSPEFLTFDYRLEGFDDDWQHAGSRRTAYYTNVPPGTYRFIVRARNREQTTAEAATSITIVPRFYETWLFKAALGLAVLLLAIVLHRVRTDELRRHQEELRASEEHFRSLIENASDMILVVDADGVITYASPAVTPALGFQPETLQGKPLTAFLNDDAEGIALLEAVRRHGRQVDVLSFCDASGATRDVESIGATCDDGRIVLNCRDITDRRRLETQLAQANRLSSLGRLAATVSHEFNNVLMGVQPFVDIIRRRSDDRVVQHATEQMARSVDRGKRISEQLLRYTRPADPTLVPLHVRTWLLDLEIEIRALAGPNVRVAVVAPPSLAIEGDAAQLNQVLANLAINARDAGATRIVFEAKIPEGNGVFSFGIVRDPQSFVQLIVRDDGSGIPDSVMPKIFEPLFTTKTTKGTGLGLAVTQQVIARHGGEIFVESTVGSGTTFHIFLRRASNESAVEAPQQVTTVSGKPGCRLLLVEDDSTIAEGVLALLESEGFETALAITGGDALHMIPKFGPDVVVLDVGLPDIGGVEVYQRILQQWPSLPVIFSTGHVDLGLLQEALPPPHPPCLLKPYEIDTLLTIIASVVTKDRTV